MLPANDRGSTLAAAPVWRSKCALDLIARTVQIRTVSEHHVICETRSAI